jgi:hypothetical protein
MRPLRGLLILGIAAVLTWAGWTAYTVASRMAADRTAATVVKSQLLDGERLVPARRSKELRGDETTDYWCFSDGLCFYPIARFRVLYPAYNDLEDDILVKEARGKLAPRTQRRRRLASRSDAARAFPALS